ncbi:peptidoglycan DD-metalloendopeptidase family protein [Algoriphagus sp.]|uniref:peptidoglycan DD-metalloendopeptidase family protein n=1 Tax=Algoriphagus sp. TaxID=1872435 RepID=UPI00263722CC|nr:peptidoglycan DD-metalloendopeptidase family protein [Algoriphagus sp.]
MNWNTIDFYPVMGEQLTAENTIKLDFSPKNEDLEKVDLTQTAHFTDFVFSQLSSAQKQFGFGGYLEHRAIYRRSEVFATPLADFRNIHLGIDLWCEAGTPVFCPFDGVIHSFQDNAGFGNYGPTIIVQHKLGERTLFSLYGHLFRSDLSTLQVGQQINRGDRLCHVGPYPENGDWPPHLHFQLIWDLNGNWGDFPGVASQREVKTYAELCPDPNLMLRFNH